MSMNWVDRDEISRHLRVPPFELDSQEITASRRRRVYWTNIPHPERLPRLRDHPSTSLQSCLQNAYALEQKAGVIFSGFQITIHTWRIQCLIFNLWKHVDLNIYTWLGVFRSFFAATSTRVVLQGWDMYWRKTQRHCDMSNRLRLRCSWAIPQTIPMLYAAIPINLKVLGCHRSKALVHAWALHCEIERSFLHQTNDPLDVGHLFKHIWFEILFFFV